MLFISGKNEKDGCVPKSYFIPIYQVTWITKIEI